MEFPNHHDSSQRSLTGARAFDNMGPYTLPPWGTPWPYTEASDPFPTYQQYPSYSSYLADSMEAYQSQHHHLVHHNQMSRTTESKPRLSKEEVEVLEAEFQKNHKPNSSTKKALAESMRVDNARINNWFQNRRAREKKERNIREYEARQKLEKEKNEAGATGREFAGRHGDLVASSAPFPNTQATPQPAAERRESSSGLEKDSETASPCHSDDIADIKGAGDPSERRRAFFGLSSTEGQIDGFSSGADCTSPSYGTPDANEPDFSLSTDDEDADSYAKHVQQAMGGIVNPPLYNYGAENLMGFPPTEPSTSEGNALRSPPIIDIASRRNRRPAPLAIDGSRSYSGGIPKTALELGRRPGTMRRVSSATGTMRISKAIGVPRSPFQMSRSPVLAGPSTKGTNAPPTPDTPVLASQPTTASVHNLDSANPSSASDLAIRDPTLRTPPTTPGGVQNFFGLNSVYEVPMAGNSFATPSIAGFAGDFNNEIPLGFPHAFANPGNCVSQPHTPAFVSPINPSSFDMTGGNAEYTWPQESVVSGDPSPADSGQGSQFLNTPASGFGMER